jgi:hypothetical protein
MDKFPDVKSPYSVAVFDTETDMVDGNKQIIMATISYKEKVYTAVTDHFVRKYGNPVDHIKSLADKYLGEILTKRNIKLDIEIVDSEIDILFKTIGKAHEWKPDFVAAWNMLFDLEKIEDACKRAEVDIADLFCDPSVPPEFRSYRLKVGPAKKITSSGVVQVFKPSQRWHYVFAPASFVWVDAMCAYRQIRQGQAEEPSYALDSILFKHLGMRKLSFAQADHITNKAQWHVFMQSQYPLEYVVYNIFDCIGVELLDEETVDLQVKLPLYSGCSDFSRFNSQPRRKVDKLHSFQLKYDPPHVIGSTGAKMSDEYDEMTWGLDEWIVMLPSHPITDSGLCLIEEDPTLRTTIRIGTSDLDVRAAYPTGEDAANISKETTVRELVKIHGVDVQTVRMNVINFSAGHVNALEFCNDILHMPNLDEMLNAYLLSTGRTVEGCGVSQVKPTNIYLN